MTESIECDAEHSKVWAALIVLVAEVRPLVQNRALVVLTMARAMGSLPINALAFMVLWFQYAGLSDFGAGVSVAFAAVGTIVGCVLGGWLGDRASLRWPNRGRISVAQATQVLLCIAMISLIKIVPKDESALVFFIGITMIIGMLLAFPAFACDLPILAEVVPWQQRGLAYAISGLFLGIFSSIGSLLVGLIADKVFHYRTRTKKINTLGPKDKKHNLDALSNAILLLFLSSWIIVFFLYFLAARLYPRYRDKVRSDAAEDRRSGRAPPPLVSGSTATTTDTSHPVYTARSARTASTWFTQTVYYDVARPGEHVQDVNPLQVFSY